MKANGRLETYIDGDLAFELKKVVFRTRNDTGFESVHFSTFFGGGDKSFASTKNEYIYFKDFNVSWEGWCSS